MKVNYNKRIIIVISSPSGAGKTSACHKLIERNKTIETVKDIMVKKTDNTIDDQLCDMLEKALFPGR